MSTSEKRHTMLYNYTFQLIKSNNTKQVSFTVLHVPSSYDRHGQHKRVLSCPVRIGGVNYWHKQTRIRIKRGHLAAQSRLIIAKNLKPRTHLLCNWRWRRPMMMIMMMMMMIWPDIRIVLNMRTSATGCCHGVGADASLSAEHSPTKREETSNGQAAPSSLSFPIPTGFIELRRSRR